MNAYRFVTQNIESCTDETALAEVMVEVYCGDEKSGIFIPKKLIQINQDGVSILRRAKKRFDLIYNIYMKESSGAKVNRWNFD
ncbi:MAG TPA: hypothetical protein PJ997_03055 [Candidatus Paceibacterota bacterium]|nr:hypothetical protein [Candidatus Paceibacterota bacterium]